MKLIFIHSQRLRKTTNFSVQTSTGETILINTPPLPEFAYGDMILVSGNPELRLLNNKTQIMPMSFPKIVLVKNRENNILAVIYDIRQKIIDVFQRTLPKNSAGFFLGIDFGIKRDLSRDFLANNKLVGVMHVIAASGMNVTMVEGFIFYLFALVFLYLCMPLLLYFEKTVNIFGDLSGKVAIDNLPWQFSASYYLFLVSYLVFYLEDTAIKNLQMLLLKLLDLPNFCYPKTYSDTLF